MSYYYRLVDRVPMPCTDTEWSEMFQSSDHLLWRTTTKPDTQVSTVFIGTAVCLFETVVFDCKCREICIRSETYAEALEAHCNTLKELSNGR